MLGTVLNNYLLGKTIILVIAKCIDINLPYLYNNSRRKVMKKFKFISIIVTFILLFSLSACSFDLGDTSESESVSLVSYDVSNDYFATATFQKSTIVDASAEGDVTYKIIITSTCTVSLHEYTAEVSLYSKDKTLLEVKTVTIEEVISANTEFSFDFEVSGEVKLATKSVEVVYSGKTYEAL